MAKIKPFNTFNEEGPDGHEEIKGHSSRRNKVVPDKSCDHPSVKYMQIQGMENEADRWLEDRMLTVALLLNALDVDWDDFIEYYELQWQHPRNEPTHTFASDTNLDEDFL
jgi:hypothetical protein